MAAVRLDENGQTIFHRCRDKPHGVGNRLKDHKEADRCDQLCKVLYTLAESPGIT